MDKSSLKTGGTERFRFEKYGDERMLRPIINLIDKDLSEPYSIYTYRHFLYGWPELCQMALEQDRLVGVVICRITERAGRLRGYIGMLAVAKTHRQQGLGRELVLRVVRLMEWYAVDEIVLEAEADNIGALRLYESLGFVRDKFLDRYYLSGKDAYRLKLWFT